MGTVIPTRVVVRVSTAEWMFWMARFAGFTVRAVLFLLGLALVVLIVLAAARLGITVR